jgi:hypothetical protein
VAVVVAVLVVGGDDDAPTTSTTTTTADAPALERFGSRPIDGDAALREPAALGGYRVTYRVIQRDRPGHTMEELTVARPFISELRASEVDGAVISVQRWAFGRVLTRTGDADQQVFAIGPTVPGYDFHPSVVVDEAIEAGLLERREQREVAGRRCQVYRAASTISDGRLAPLVEESDEYADVCFDAHGLLLEEWWVLDGNPIRQRVATAVVDAAPGGFGREWSDEPTSQTVGQGGGSVLRLRAGSAPPGAFFQPAAVPDGFVHVGRYAVIPPQAIDAEGADPNSTVASVADVWQRGTDVLLLDQGGSLGGTDVYPRDPANRVVDVPGMGDAEVVLGLGANELRLEGGRAGTYVRVLGTLAVEELLAFARSLVETEGNEIVIEE